MWAKAPLVGLGPVMWIRVLLVDRSPACGPKPYLWAEALLAGLGPALWAEALLCGPKPCFVGRSPALLTGVMLLDRSPVSEGHSTHTEREADFRSALSRE